jgi:L-seryl-tRNA(Ser) seleniumtransferase
MVKQSVQDMLRKLPSVDAFIQNEVMEEALARHPRKLVLESIRYVLDLKRRVILEQPEVFSEIDLNPSHLLELILEHLEFAADYTLKPVINATGIIIHTNLGRSLLPKEALERLQLLCCSYNNLEYDIAQGRRGSRYVHAEKILCELTGSEAALVVNNNAGAVLLVLNTLAQGREVVVSRGQLVEIGGSFRIPDVMRSSGAILKEVGTTNRTHPRDYESAITEKTALLMKVHTSNYRIVGFSSEVSIEEMVLIGKKHDLPVMEDLGSGSLVDFSSFGLKDEPTVQEAIRSGADIVTFSGDKLLGGPQAGIILGKKELIAECRKNPLTRALRVDKLTLAALEATLRLYRDERQAFAQVPTLRMISASLSELEKRADRLASLLRETDRGQRLDVTVQLSASQVGGGSLPAQNLPTYVVAVKAKDMSTQKIEEKLRSGRPPVIGRIEADHYLMDVRTIQENEIPLVQQAFERLLAQGSTT